MTHETIIETLKGVLKRKKINYKTLAVEIGMSESGLKKLLTAKDISLNRLAQITDILGVPLSDIVNLAYEEEIKKVRLSKKQEEHLLSDSMLLNVLWRMVIEGKTEEETMRAEGIGRRQLNSSLLKLHNLDLIKISPSGKVSSVHRGLYRWVGDGKLLRKLNRDWSKATLSEVLSGNLEGALHQLSFFQLSRESCDQLHDRLIEVIDEFARKSRREKMQLASSDLQPVSLLIAAARKGFLD